MVELLFSGVYQTLEKVRQSSSQIGETTTNVVSRQFDFERTTGRQSCEWET
jgi:hypothetical protein